MAAADSFGARGTLDVGGRTYSIARLDVFGDRVARLPFSLRVLLENLLRNEDGVTVTAADIEAMASWDPTSEPDNEIAFAPARVLMQDFTGVPCVVDLAAMRDAVSEIGGDIAKVNPLVPAELVIDHSIIADHFGTDDSLRQNAELEYQRNIERYRFLKWGQGAFHNFTVVPPSTGICHQVNLEYLARVVFSDADGNAYPDTVVGTDSHTTMVNGLGVLGWGVGGIEAEAAMLGQPISMLTPRVVGFKLKGALPEGATATDLVLTVTQLLRKHGVVGKFVEFYGAGVTALPLENRATIGNMSPEYGSTCAIFPIDDETIRYLRFTGRSAEQIALVEAYAKAQGLWHDPSSPEPVFSEYLELDLGTVEPCISGPSRPQDLIPLRQAKEMFSSSLVASVPEPAASPGSADEASAASFPASDPPAAMSAEAPPTEDTSPPPIEPDAERVVGRPRHASKVSLDDGTTFEIDHGHVVIAAITSCTNTSNPSVMVAAGLLAKKAVEAGLQTKPWVKTTLAPGSKVVVDYYDRAGLTPYLDKLRFNIVGFGCTTCIGNSGPILPEISKAVNDENLSVAAVLSGNRNFEGRINPDVRLNYLASPPLVVAYALAGTMDWDPFTETFPGSSVMMKDIWPTEAEVAETIRDAVQAEMFSNRYSHALDGDEHWQAVSVPTGDQFDWDPKSTYVRKPPYFDGMPAQPAPRADITGARVLAVLGDSITTDHISPAGNIRKDGPAGRYLVDGGVTPDDFNSYGARRGNHEVMIRGTFANIRLRNRLAPGTEGGVTVHLPDGEQMSIYDASMRYQRDGVPLVVLAGKEYGSGSSRDWAAKGAALLGIKAVLAESFERIHRSNLIGMGVLPLELPASVEELGLSGHEVFDIVGVAGEAPIPRTLTVTADGRAIQCTVRIDTPKEQDYYRHGGILQYVLRQMVK